eukprot:s3991_g4.t1
MAKKRKRVPPAREAALSFWACVLHRLDDPSTDPGCEPLPSRFTCAGSYYSSLATLVLAESRALARASRHRLTSPSEARLTSLSQIGPGKVAKQRGVSEHLLCFKAHVLPGTDWPTMRTAWAVELRSPKEKKGALFFVERASAFSGYGQEVSINLCGYALPTWRWLQQTSLHDQPILLLRPLDDLVPSLRMWTACVLAPKPPFLHQLVGARGATHQIFTDSDAESETQQADAGTQAQPEGKVSMSDSEDSSQPSQQMPVEGLNFLQKEAISKILSSDGLQRRCHLLQGPPGTGKTRAVVALLQQLARRHKLGKEGRILVSAPSNGAVQVALESFSKTEEGRRCPLCLVGVEDRVPPDGPLRAAFIHTRVQHALALVKQSSADPRALQEAAEALRTLERSVPAAYLRLKLPRNLSTKHLQKCLETWEEASLGQGSCSEADDASDAETSESESSERKAHSARRPVRGTLVERLTELARRERFGEAPQFETEQLKAAAAVFCTLSCAGRPGLQMSLRDGIETVLVDEVPLCLQPKQLVLVGDPMQLSATVCHSDMAKSAHFCRSMMERLMGLGQEHIMLQEQYRMHPEISRFPSARFYGGRLVDVLAGGSQDSKHHALPPYAVVDVAGTEEVYHKESRIINRREDGRVARRCPPLVVITFYNGQAALIRKLLVETGIEVHTVDSFQGSEAEVVLLSFVRANAQRRLGFLSEFRRLNVALTRAKHSLIVFANAALLKGSFSDDVTALFEDASRRNLIWREEQLGQLLSPSAGRQATRLLNAQPGQRGPAKRAFSSPEFTKGHNVRGRKRGQRQPEPRAFTDAPLKELQPRRPAPCRRDAEGPRLPTRGRPCATGMPAAALAAAAEAAVARSRSPTPPPGIRPANAADMGAQARIVIGSKTTWTGQKCFGRA